MTFTLDKSNTQKWEVNVLTSLLQTQTDGWLHNPCFLRTRLHCPSFELNVGIGFLQKVLEIFVF